MGRYKVTNAGVFGTDGYVLKDGPGYQKGTDVRRVKWLLDAESIDEELKERIRGCIDAAVYDCEVLIEELTQRLIQVKELYTKAVPPTAFSRRYTKETELTIGVIGKSETFLSLLTEERKRESRNSRNTGDKGRDESSSRRNGTTD